MEIYLVRHGQTESNSEHRLQGNLNTPLNANGRELAGKTGEAVEETPFDLIYSSPLDRAFETACLIRGHRNIPIIRDDRLREIGFGVNEGKLYDEILADPDDKFRYFFSRPELYEPKEGGETFEEVCERAADFMRNELEPQKDSLKRVMIVAHGTLNKGILTYIRRHDMSHFWDGDLQKNCGIVLINLDDEGYHILDENFDPALKTGEG